MAFFKQAFFKNNLSVGNAPRYFLQALDGELELDIQLPADGRKRFMYHLWRSTLNGKVDQSSFNEFELSQFVLLHQENGKLRCNVVFPTEGDYKLNLFAKSEGSGEGMESGSYSLSCSYIMHCDKAKEEWNALPRNKRYVYRITRSKSGTGLFQNPSHQLHILSFRFSQERVGF